MSNAAIYLHPDGYDTTRPRILGRHSAGESFLRGFLRHAEVDRHHFWNAGGFPQQDLEALLQRIHPPSRPVNWIGRTNRPGLRAAGVVNLPGPNLAGETWARRIVGPQAYSLCGITHTTATARVMDIFADMLIAPVEPHDALICTSTAVRQSVEAQLDGVREYLLREFGPRRRAEPQRVTIPLGVNAADFATSPAHRKAWRERLDIPEDAAVALFVGRFNIQEKMNPALMALALERAAQETGRPIYWVNAGWAETPEALAQYHDESRKLCPSVHYREVDGRPADTRFSIWSVADFFISFSDNIQETFGLTPIEAMAAGLPCVVTDWDGYKDTVRHGEDGFRIPTFAPAPGQGADLAYWFANELMGYTNYVAAAGQYTAVDFAEASAAIASLVLNPDLRRRLGRQAQARARSVFDWSVIIPQYQALWADQNARRAAAAAEAADVDNPFRPDPFTLFAGYPTHHVTSEWRVALAPGMDRVQARALLSGKLAAYSPFNRPTLEEAEAAVTWLADRPGAAISELIEILPPNRRSHLARGVLWMARFGVLVLSPPT